MKTTVILSIIALATLGACQSHSHTSNQSNTSSASSNVSSSKGICQQVRGDTSSGGRNVLYRCNGHAVLASAEAQSILAGGAKVSFSSGGNVIKANLTTRQAANRVGNSDEATCERAFINAVKKFQNTAASLGGSRVTGFQSYLNKKVLGGGQYECEVGTFHGRVVMRGDIAR